MIESSHCKAETYDMAKSDIDESREDQDAK